MTGGLAGFISRYPRVWHAIEDEGAGCETLYPASHLFNLAGLGPDNANRDDFRLLTLPRGRTAVLRQQLMRDEPLSRTLAGSFSGRPDLWRNHINQHVFFWLSEDRRDRFIGACVRLRALGSAGPGRAPVVIEIETRRILPALEDAAYFSLFNTGSTLRGGARARRDDTTFCSVREWHGERAVELAIRAPVPLG